MSEPARAQLLLVDDEEANRDLGARRLARAGWDVACAASGEEALARVARGGIELVLLDYTMPAMDGCEVLRRLRERHTHSALPVIMATARDGKDDLLRALAAGANDYVTKPIDFDVLFARIRTQLALRSHERALRESQARYELATQGASDGLWDWDLAENRMHFSARWCAMVGLAPEACDAGPEHWLARVHGSDVAALRSAIRAHVEGLTPQLEAEYRLTASDGTCRWMLARGVAARDAEGRAVRMAGSQTDLTRHKAIDTDTGLGNGLLLADRIERAQAETARDPRARFALLSLRVERLAALAASLEPALLARFVRAISERLLAIVAPTDTVCSIGAGRFAVVTRLAPDDPATERLAERISAELAHPVDLGQVQRESSVAVGIAECTPGLTPPALLRDADLAAAGAQAMPRHVLRFDDRLREAAARRDALEAGLRAASLESELELHFQPIVSLERGTLAGFEALVRWRQGDALVPPGDFISIAEDIGAIGRIGRWAIMAACREAAGWPPLPNGRRAFVSVNVSPHQLREDASLRSVEEALAASGLPPAALKLEITETALLDDAEAAARALARLRALGVRLCLDDFGTGYSSLQQLQVLPIDVLKIDRCFVAKLGGDHSSTTMVAMVLDLARNLSMDVVAEGIETEDQRDQLAELGCALGQGYLFARPLPAERIAEWIRRPAASSGASREIEAPAQPS